MLQVIQKIAEGEDQLHPRIFRQGILQRNPESFGNALFQNSGIALAFLVVNKKLTFCGKTNVLTYAFDLWERVFNEIGEKEYKDITQKLFPFKLTTTFLQTICSSE